MSVEHEKRKIVRKKKQKKWFICNEKFKCNSRGQFFGFLTRIFARPCPWKFWWTRRARLIWIWLKLIVRADAVKDNFQGWHWSTQTNDEKNCFEFTRTNVTYHSKLWELTNDFQNLFRELLFFLEGTYKLRTADGHYSSLDVQMMTIEINEANVNHWPKIKGIRSLHSLEITQCFYFHLLRVSSNEA